MIRGREYCLPVSLKPVVFSHVIKAVNSLLQTVSDNHTERIRCRHVVSEGKTRLLERVPAEEGHCLMPEQGFLAARHMVHEAIPSWIARGAMANKLGLLLVGFPFGT